MTPVPDRRPHDRHLHDPSLQLAPPGERAGFWLFALTFALPVLITAVGIAVLCGAMWWGLARLMRRQALELSADALELRSSFYRCRMPLAELELDQARLVDLDERTEYRPAVKANGFSIPGFRSGWFLLRNRRRTFVAIADGRRKLWLPGSGKHDLLLEPRDPTALLERLRELASPSGQR